MLASDWSMIPVYDGSHGHVVGVLPGAAIQEGHVLPDKASQDAIIAIVKQELKT